MTEEKKEEVLEMCENCNKKDAGVRAIECGDKLCPACLVDLCSECSDCDDTFYQEELTYVDRADISVCGNCYSRNDYFCCDACGDYCTADDYSEDGRCFSCNDDEDGGEIAYREINLKTKAFQDNENGSIIKSSRPFGVELEMVSDEFESLRRISKDLKREVGVANDGSISGGKGIEIQTPILKGKKGEELLIEIANKAKECGFTVNKSCGMHCHLDAKDFISTTSERIFLHEKPESIGGESLCMLVKKDSKLWVQIRNLCSITYFTQIRGGAYDEKGDVWGKTSLVQSGLSPIEIKAIDRLNEYVSDNELKLLKNTYIILLRNVSDLDVKIPVCIDRSGENPTKLICEIVEVSNNDRISALKKLMSFYVAFDDIFLAMISESRRGNTYCKPIKSQYSIGEILNSNNQEQFDRMWYKGDRAYTKAEINKRKKQGYDSSRYVGANFHSLFGSNGTLEIRYHSGTLDSGKILSWVSLHQTIMDRIANDEIEMADISKATFILDFDKKLKLFFGLLRLSTELESYVEGRIKTYK